VKFLIDNQLPAALAGMLVSRGFEARHVLDVGLEGASDIQIWKHAEANTLVLITKDEDFPRLASLPGARVQVVWVRLGNCRTKSLLAAFDSVLSKMQAALQAGDLVVEIR
jgi:predicted nuclease of predicted toxin-antitoxin system